MRALPRLPQDRAGKIGGAPTPVAGCPERDLRRPSHPRWGERLQLSQEEPLLSDEARRPREPFGVREAEVRAQRVTHRVDEPVNAAWREPVLPPHIEHLHASLGPVDPRLDPADEAVPENDRQHVPAPTALGRWLEE